MFIRGKQTSHLWITPVRFKNTLLGFVNIHHRRKDIDDVPTIPLRLRGKALHALKNRLNVARAAGEHQAALRNRVFQ